MTNKYVEGDKVFYLSQISGEPDKFNLLLSVEGTMPMVVGCIWRLESETWINGTGELKLAPSARSTRVFKDDPKYFVDLFRMLGLEI